MNLGQHYGSAGVAAPTLAAGAIGVWYADTAQATPRRAIPNAMSVAPLSQNLLAAPRRLFGSTEFWTGAGGTVTITDDAATSNDGLTEASTVVMAAGTLFRPAQTVNIAAGTYTLVAEAKRNAGSDQTFCMSKDNTGTRSSVMTATSAWQRFVYTFTSGTSTAITQLSICTVDGVTAANLQIGNFELFAGSSDLGATVLSGHMYCGFSHNDTTATVGAGELDLSTGGMGLIQFGSAQSITTGITVQAMICKVTAGSSYQSFLSDVKSYTKFSACTEVGSVPYVFLQAADGTLFGQTPSKLWSLLNIGYHVFTMRANGTTIDLWVDDVKLFSMTQPFTAFSFKDLWTGIVATLSLSSGYKQNSLVVYGSALTDSAVRANVSYLQTRLSLSALAVGTINKIIVSEGDSITGGFPYSYPYQGVFTGTVLGVNLGVSGSTIANLVSRVARVNDIVPPVKGARKFVFTAMDGANDIATLGASTYLANLDAYINTSITASYNGKIVGTVLPNANAAINTQRNLANPVLRTWPGSAKCTSIMDFASDATYGTDAAGANTAYYPDGTHPTTTVQLQLASAYYQTAINAV